MNNSNYFCAYDTVSDKILTCVRVYGEQNVWEDICKKHIDTPEFAKKFFDDPYEAMYHTDLKAYLKDVAPHVLTDIVCAYAKNPEAIKGYNPVLDDNVQIRLATKSDYIPFMDAVYVMQSNFHDYAASDKALLDHSIKLNFDTLEKNGFKRNETLSEISFKKSVFGFDDYKSVVGEFESLLGYGTIYVTIDNSGFNNSHAHFNIHIDNEDRETIGSTEIDYVWQLNVIMNIYGVDFIL